MCVCVCVCVCVVPACADNQIGVDRPLSSVQSVHKRLLLCCAHLHDIPPDWREVKGEEGDRRAGRERERERERKRERENKGFSRCGRNEGREDERRMLLEMNTLLYFEQKNASPYSPIHLSRPRPPSSYPQRSSDHSLVQSARVDTARSYSH